MKHRQKANHESSETRDLQRMQERKIWDVQREQKDEEERKTFEIDVMT